jgi:hypothetical protein
VLIVYKTGETMLYETNREGAIPSHAEVVELPGSDAVYIVKGVRWFEGPSPIAAIDLERIK